MIHPGACMKSERVGADAAVGGEADGAVVIPTWWAGAEQTPTGAEGRTPSPQAAGGARRGTGAQIPLNKESTTTAPTEAHTAPQTVGGCHSPPTARNAPHRARRSPTQGAAWHGGTASAPRPDPATQMPHSTHSTAERESRKALIFNRFSYPRKMFSKKVKKGVDMRGLMCYIRLR